MATKIKRIYKKFKLISKIFVVKEREMEIGCPTDVKHVAHIGWDGPSGTAPCCVNEFKTGPDFTASSIRNSRGSKGLLQKITKRSKDPIYRKGGAESGLTKAWHWS